MEEPLVELKALLDSHDWTYSFSDDNRVYRRGFEQRRAIEKLAQEIGDEGLRLYRAYIDVRFNPATGFTWSKVA